MIKNTFLIFMLLVFTNSISQSKYSLRADFVKALFGVYQTELEYKRNDKISYGLGLLYMNTNSMLILKDENANANAYSISPFVRYYTKSSLKSSSFYQATFRLVNYIGISDHIRRKNAIALDVVWGRQFKISKFFFIEPSIGLGAFRKLDEENKYFVIPYPLVNFNAIIKL